MTERLHFHFFTFMHWRRKWQPTPVFLPGESQGRGSLVGCRLLILTVPLRRFLLPFIFRDMELKLVSLFSHPCLPHPFPLTRGHNSRQGAERGHQWCWENVGGGGVWELKKAEERGDQGLGILPASSSQPCHVLGG